MIARGLRVAARRWLRRELVALLVPEPLATLREERAKDYSAVLREAWEARCALGDGGDPYVACACAAPRCLGGSQWCQTCARWTPRGLRLLLVTWEDMARVLGVDL